MPNLSILPYPHLAHRCPCAHVDGASPGFTLSSRTVHLPPKTRCRCFRRHPDFTIFPGTATIDPIPLQLHPRPPGPVHPHRPSRRAGVREYDRKSPNGFLQLRCGWGLGMSAMVSRLNQFRRRCWVGFVRQRRHADSGVLNFGSGINMNTSVSCAGCAGVGAAWVVSVSSCRDCWRAGTAPSGFNQFRPTDGNVGWAMSGT